MMLPQAPFSQIQHPAASVARFNYTILDADEKAHHRPSRIGFLRFRTLQRTIRTDAVAKSTASAVSASAVSASTDLQAKNPAIPYPPREPAHKCRGEPGSNDSCAR
jgi:hypothetical protein